MNRVILIGRITKDIELRSTKDGKSVTSFSLAVSRMNKEKETDFISCVAWDKTADLMEKYVCKGDQIAVSGKIRTRNYEDKNGQKVYATEVIVDEIQFLGGKSEPKEEPKQDDGFPF